MTGYVHINHPITGEILSAVPTGKKEDNKAEVIIITPKAGISKMWITKEDICKP